MLFVQLLIVAIIFGVLVWFSLKFMAGPAGKNAKRPLIFLIVTFILNVIIAPISMLSIAFTADSGTGFQLLLVFLAIQGVPLVLFVSSAYIYFKKVKKGMGEKEKNKKDDDEDEYDDEEIDDYDEIEE